MCLHVGSSTANSERDMKSVRLLQLMVSHGE